jgi:hypothetical protein
MKTTHNRTIRALTIMKVSKRTGPTATGAGSALAVTITKGILCYASASVQGPSNSSILTVSKTGFPTTSQSERMRTATFTAFMKPVVNCVSTPYRLSLSTVTETTPSSLLRLSRFPLPNLSTVRSKMVKGRFLST